MNLRFTSVFGAVFILLAMGCGGNSENKSESAQATQGLHFQFSTAPAVEDIHDKSSWCNSNFPEPVVITADPINSTSRVFALGSGVHKVVVDFGKMAASFFLRKKDDKIVELFTSNQFPLCLPNHEHFTIAPDGYSFHFDNHHYVDFYVELKPVGEGWSVVLSFPLDYRYGVTVHRMENSH